MFNRNFRRPVRRQQNWSENLILSFRGENGETFFHPADDVAMKAFFSNLKKFDEGSFKALVGQVKTIEVNGRQMPTLTVEELRSALRVGETLFTGYEPDGGLRDCGVCGVGFQPVKVPFVHKDGTSGLGGNFAVFKAAKVEELVKQGGELGSRIEAISTTVTAEVISGEQVPSRARVLPVCGVCRMALEGVRTCALQSARVELLGADQRIGASADRYAAAAILGRPQRHAIHAGPSNGPRYNQGGRRNDRSERPQKPHADWQGADLEVETGKKLTEAGYASLTDAITAAENGELIEKGIAHPMSIGPITFALKRAAEGNATLGSAKGAASVRGAQRPSKEVGGKRGKTRELDATKIAGGNRRQPKGLAALSAD